MQALIQNGAVAQFPYSLAQMKRDNPGTSFPRRVDLPFEAVVGALVDVIQEDRPAVPDGSVAVPNAAPALVGGNWVLGWTVRAKTPEEVAAERDAMSVPRGQFAVAAAGAGLVTEQEALNWAGGNSLPATVNAVIDALPQAEQLPARVEALTALNVQRMHPLVLMLQASLGLTDEQTDGLFA
ncbi:hypothetical protein P5P81_03255 [Tritonibacter mobilis]|nr:hypothetical protein [Tritonibacter mobilis]